MTVTAIPAQRSAAETKARILAVAQSVFAEKGYSHASLRDIAKIAGVAPSLVVKYFRTKTQLFEDALIAAIIPLETFQADRARFGEAIVAAVLDRGAPLNAPAMIALSMGDAESREISVRVVENHVLEPMARWLASPVAKAQALNILMMTIGFSIYCRAIDQSLEEALRTETIRIFARSLQDLVDSGE